MITIEEIREESRRRNSGDVAQGHAWGVVIPALLTENDRLREELQSARNLLSNCGVIFDPDILARIDAALKP